MPFNSQAFSERRHRVAPHLIHRVSDPKADFKSLYFPAFCVRCRFVSAPIRRRSPMTDVNDIREPRARMLNFRSRNSPSRL
jgi:hypothetical protein